MENDKNNLTARDLLKDEYFLEWVLKPDPENTLYWENRISRHPQLKPEVEKAVQLLSTDFPLVLPAAKVDRIWNNIAAGTVDGEYSSLKPVAGPARHRISTWYKIAAVFLGIMLAGGLWKYGKDNASLVLVSTEFGETRHIILPDKSTVVLNGNSSLEYQEEWGNLPRAVKLTGEAFFSVVHTKDDLPFRVEMNDTVMVEVLGTRFTVTNRPRKTRVVLSEGSVRVAEELMQPGELMERGALSGEWQKYKIENPDDYAAFRQDKVIFKDTPLSEIERLLEDNYGYAVTFATPSLAHRNFTGSCPHNRVDLLLKTISRVFNLNIKQHGKEITIDQK